MNVFACISMYFVCFLKSLFKGMTNKSITYSRTDSFTSPPKDEVLKHHFERRAE